MLRVFGILTAIFSLAACSSGVSNTGAGGTGTDCQTGALNFACTAQLSAPTTVLACAGGTDEAGQPVAATTTDTGTLNIRISDPLGEFSSTFQGVTLSTYDVSFQSGQGGAPNLGTRRFTNTQSFEMSDSVASGSVTIPIVDPTTKRQFVNQASCSTIYPYLVTVRATGTDFATNSRVVITARTNIGIGGTGAEAASDDEAGSP